MLWGSSVGKTPIPGCWGPKMTPQLLQLSESLSYISGIKSNVFLLTEFLLESTSSLLPIPGSKHF